MTIVCATASTVSNEEPLRVAAALARSADLRLVVASVAQRDDRRALRRLNGAALLLHADQTNAVAQLCHGTLEETIAGLCEEVRARFLVVGSAKTTLRAWHASKVERLAASVRVPILVVRDAAPFIEWAAGESPLCVLVVVNSTSASEPGDQGRAWIGELGVRAMESVTEEVWRTDRELERDGLVPIACGESAPEILEVAAREDVDLIVLATHHEHGLSGVVDSIAHEVLARGTASVALVPEPTVGPVG